MRIFLLSFALLFNISAVIAQSPYEKNVPPPPGVSNAPPLAFYVQRGQQQDETNVQKYVIKGGETVFIPMGATNLANQPGSKPKQEQNEAYLKEKAALAAQIAKKITAVQEKQRELDSEIYPAYRAPLGLDLQQLQNQLSDLQNKREKMDSINTVREVGKQAAEKAYQESKPKLPQSVVPGIYVKPSLEDNLVNLDMRSQGLKNEAGGSEIQATIRIPLGKWIQIPNNDIWVKVEPAKTEQ
jgi:hypothetical protein